MLSAYASGFPAYGLSYTKWVDHDYGGKDRLDHIHAMTEFLPQDKRLDVKRADVIGRSYGGYMTLMQAARLLVSFTPTRQDDEHN